MWKSWPLQAERDGRAVLRIDGKRYERQLRRIESGPILEGITASIADKYTYDISRELVQAGDIWLFEAAPHGPSRLTPMTAGGRPSTLETLAGMALLGTLRAIRFLTEERAPAVRSRLSTGARRRVCIKCTCRRARLPRFDTLSDTLRSVRPCDLWTPLEAKGRRFPQETDHSGRRWTLLDSLILFS